MCGAEQQSRAVLTLEQAVQRPWGQNQSPAPTDQGDQATEDRAVPGAWTLSEASFHLALTLNSPFSPTCPALALAMGMCAQAKSQ